MNDRAICPDCDRPVAIDVDLSCADCTDQADCASCAAMCWRNYHPACQNKAVEWRARALAAESRVRTLEAVIAAVCNAEPSAPLSSIKIAIGGEELGLVNWLRGDIDESKAVP